MISLIESKSKICHSSNGNVVRINSHVLLVRGIMDDPRNTSHTSFGDHVCYGVLFLVYVIIRDTMKCTLYTSYALHPIGHHWWLKKYESYDPIDEKFWISEYLYVFDVMPLCREKETPKSYNFWMIVSAPASLPPKMKTISRFLNNECSTSTMIVVTCTIKKTNR